MRDPEVEEAARMIHAAMIDRRTHSLSRAFARHLVAAGHTPLEVVQLLQREGVHATVASVERLTSRKRADASR